MWPPPPLFAPSLQPPTIAKSRLYVDCGSRTYVDSLLRVPVASARELGLVSRKVYDAWMFTDQAETMCEEIGPPASDTEAPGQKS